jgi:hypothetical protein
MTGMNTGLAQLALLLHGMGRGGLGSQFNLPTDPYSMAPQTPQPMSNSWAANPGFHAGGGSHLPITPAQEILLGPMNPAEVIPYTPEWAIPKPEFIPLPDTGPLPPDTIPPYIPPRAIPYDDTNDDVNEIREKPVKMSKRCADEWAQAEYYCQEKRAAQYRSGNFEPFDMARCIMGYVSVACGGQPLDYGPKGKPAPKPKGKPNSYIMA